MVSNSFSWPGCCWIVTDVRPSLALGAFQNNSTLWWVILPGTGGFGRSIKTCKSFVEIRSVLYLHAGWTYLVADAVLNIVAHHLGTIDCCSREGRVWEIVSSMLVTYVYVSPIKHAYEKRILNVPSTADEVAKLSLFDCLRYTVRDKLGHLKALWG